jgi:2-polyprenyl-3-methyl-5-hydroxy-6-metoxy-1,4-benzoquinol methylase
MAVSWFEERPDMSLRLICGCARPGASVVGAGGGASRLAGNLLELGYQVTVLDIAAEALAKARAQLGGWAAEVNWVTADVTRW